eukprot:COSAG01_NODE_50002_length_367_cov_0.958955_1_plen_65_part_10
MYPNTDSYHRAYPDDDAKYAFEMPGAEVLLLAQHGSDWQVAQYMLTCNGWVWSGHAWAAASDMCR